MPKPYRIFEVGTTPQFTWVGSTAPTALGLQIKTASESVVASLAAVQSAGGNWYAFVTIPNSFGRYPADLIAEWTATASTHVSSLTPFLYRMPFTVKRTAAYGAGR
jgi:hypothetical protein